MSATTFFFVILAVTLYTTNALSVYHLKLKRHYEPSKCGASYDTCLASGRCTADRFVCHLRYHICNILLRKSEKPEREESKPLEEKRIPEKETPKPVEEERKPEKVTAKPAKEETKPEKETPKPAKEEIKLEKEQTENEIPPDQLNSTKDLFNKVEMPENQMKTK